VNRVDFDVIIAGAGAAGSVAAYTLTQGGLRTLVVDKSRLPRYKPCGGAIPRLTLDRLPFAVEGVIRATPAEVRITFPGCPHTDVPLPGGPVVMVIRSEFDALLLARSGAEVLDGTAITSVTETGDGVQVRLGNRHLSARTLVGADGAFSQVARSLGLRPRRQLCGALEAEVPLDDGLRTEYGNRALFALGVIPGGYAWVFPKGDCLSVGIGRFRPGRGDLRAALTGEMARLGIRLDGVRVQGHPIPCYQSPPWPLWNRRTQEKLSTRRCLLVGDAAGLVDPLIGEGIRYAITSGRLAAEAILQEDLAVYESRIWREIGHSLATAGMAARLFYRWPRRCYELGVRNPAIVRLFLDLLADRASYQGIGRRLIASTVRWLVQSTPRTLGQSDLERTGKDDPGSGLSRR